MTKSRRPTVEALRAGVKDGNRAMLARAITLVESTLASDQHLAWDLLERLGESVDAFRVGVTGPPGVGKSTFIESLGRLLIGRGLSVAVLAIDPSSARTGGSILGDKSRMNRLAQEERAFIRPSPSAVTLGGVARRTRESMLLCEAAGYDVILIETVGVGQSESMVAEMVDFFLVLALPGAGDELQSIKRGLLELADHITINKSDGDNKLRAKRTHRDFESALGYLSPKYDSWRASASCVSALHGEGLQELWEVITSHRQMLESTGLLGELRGQGRLNWFWREVSESVLGQVESSLRGQNRLKLVESALAEGTAFAPRLAAEVLASLSPAKG